MWYFTRFLLSLSFLLFPFCTLVYSLGVKVDKLCFVGDRNDKVTVTVDQQWLTDYGVFWPFCFMAPIDISINDESYEHIKELRKLAEDKNYNERKVFITSMTFKNNKLTGNLKSEKMGYGLVKATGFYFSSEAAGFDSEEYCGCCLSEDGGKKVYKIRVSNNDVKDFYCKEGGVELVLPAKKLIYREEVRLKESELGLM